MKDGTFASPNFNRTYPHPRHNLRVVTSAERPMPAKDVGVCQTCHMRKDNVSSRTSHRFSSGLKWRQFSSRFVRRDLVFSAAASAERQKISTTPLVFAND
jgi:hypothetical protein